MPADNAAGERPLTLAIAALGGQGGGVLAEWLIATAEREGFIAQYTSVPGVAQRTGATVYYLEFFPRAAAEAAGREPVMALLPVPGDVDAVLAGELSEAARAVLRGIVTPDRTVLVTSTHREYAQSEKGAVADGRADSATLLAAAERAARRCIAFDMAATALAADAVISAVMLGAAAGAGVLPFAREAFEQIIRDSGLAVERNLAGFAAGFDAAAAGGERASAPAAAALPQPALPAGLFDAELAALPGPARELARLGAARLIDYQDREHAASYLRRLRAIAALDAGGEGAAPGMLTAEVARTLALWMSYEDVIRVADLKTRRERFERVRREVRADPEQIVHTTEFMHPRVEEIADTLPPAMARLLLGVPPLRAAARLATRRGRRVASSHIGGFLLLYALAGLRRWRRRTARFAREEQRIDEWLQRVGELAAADHSLAMALATAPRILKGYGDTHARGWRQLGDLLAALPTLRAEPDPAGTLRALVDAALADEEGHAFAEAMAGLGGHARAEAAS